ncbi:MAG: BREX-1 system adenine-specific DNA-methyltransferase PglX [Moraxellaceae bacterium]|nr:BREX-1 system adenine-specific DNA-methyltransferase PglX [Moraxellaceae bacterium]
MSQQDKAEMAKYFYRVSAADFMKIPGSPIAYWTTNGLISAFVNGELLSNISIPRQGLATMDNARFTRIWHEISMSASSIISNHKGCKWFPYNKGGDFRKWYGNQEILVNWLENGHEIKQLAISRYGSASKRVVNEGSYFLPSITWSKISSSKPSFRYQPQGAIFDVAGMSIFPSEDKFCELITLLNSKLTLRILELLSPTLNFEAGHIGSIPVINSTTCFSNSFEKLVELSKLDWDSYETSWKFNSLSLIKSDNNKSTLQDSYQKLRIHWREITLEMQRLEEENNSILIHAYSLQEELTPEVPLNEITLTCNPYYRYGNDKSEAELETLLKCDTIEELVSYAIGCMMGRYSLDKPGLILASQGESLQDYLSQIPLARFVPDDDGILPLTDQEWFADDATNRFREFVRTAWGEKTLQENLDFIAESLCLHAIKPKKGEDSTDAIRRYLSSQFYKDHLKTYKKRPIYWLFSSGRHKAFECLVYLHRYNEGTLARMRTEYVIPLTAKLNAHASKLEKDIDASSSTAEKKALEKQLATLHNQQAELATFDEKLRHFADQRIRLDLDDGVKVNYGKFGDLLAEVNAITGDSQ